MKITLIGASGFVGTRLITLLKKAQRYEMLNIDLQQSRFFPEVTAIGDVRDQDYLDKKLEGAECVVLLAAQHRDDVVPVSLYYDTNVGGIEKTLKAMEKNKMGMFKNTLLLAQQGNEKAMEKLLNRYDPLLKKCSIIQGHFDEDLYQSLILEFVRAVSTFKI